jgi:hypothetical protein
MGNSIVITEPVENSQVLKKLFKEIYINRDNEKTIPDDFAKVNHFGNNCRKIFIGVPGEDDCIIKDNERALLQKILAAIKLTEGDVFIVSIKEIDPGSFNRLIGNDRFDKLLFFGVTPLQVGWYIDVQLYVRTYFMEKEILFAESLPVLSANESAKKKLWGQLQALFNIK